MSLSQVPPFVVSRGIAVDQMFTELCDILWSSANQVHGRARSSHRTHPASMVERCVLPSLVARNGRMARLTQGLGLPLIKLESRCAGSIVTVWFDPPNGNSGTIGRNRLPNCATVTFAYAPFESEVAFVSPSNVLFPMNLWNGGSNSIPLGTCRRSSDVCAQWRNHFSQIASCQKAEFDTVFAAAISDQFRAYCADQATGEFVAPFTESEFVWLSGSARTLPQVVMVSRIPFSRPVWIGARHYAGFLQHRVRMECRSFSMEVQRGCSSLLTRRSHKS